MSQNGNQLKNRFLSKGREKSVPGAEGIAMINHGSEVMISVKTPLGRLYRIETTFIGTNGKDEIFLELPSISQSEFDDYFYDGFWLTVKAISEKGEGAVVNFRTQISQIVHKPIKLLILDVPLKMSLQQLRSEPRYEVKLQGSIALPNRELLVDFKDLSANGCCFQKEVNGPRFDQDTFVCVEVRDPKVGHLFRLTGQVRNIHKSGAMNNYGMMFDEQGQKQAKQLMAQLIFDGSKLSFKQK
ncbi:flagellar brake protein [Photobacterium sp. SDRW27]|uniref:flagellar brake protein n=1 Tax=Photobacterium obscurum TaxID=2829490 RepID=UPI002244DC1F|nr:flagellar brake protein [Photobacterium obscurum]MCW8330896.1 flagellar brake protein [Photobacterium obscurum]